MKRRVKILSVSFENSSRREILKELKVRMTQKKKTRIFTPNPQILLAAHRDPSLRALLSKADLLLPDGIGLIYASKILGTPLKERISGIDIAEDILMLAEEKNLSVFLLGGKKGCANRAARNLKITFPRLNICGCHNGYFAKYGEENLLVRAKIAQKRPDILFVCFGFPLQERWIAENLHYLPTVKIAAGLGGSLDVWSGKVPRAPKVFQKIGMEWLWRLMIEPRRIRVFADIPQFMLLVTKQKMALRKKANRT